MCFNHCRKRWNNAGKDVVVLHIFQRGKYCPNLSPYVIKLEMYLRMADIQYQVCCWTRLLFFFHEEAKICLFSPRNMTLDTLFAYTVLYSSIYTVHCRLLDSVYFYWTIICLIFMENGRGARGGGAGSGRRGASSRGEASGGGAGIPVQDSLTI